MYPLSCTRRQFLLAAGGAVLSACALACRTPDGGQRSLAAIEVKTGGRVGVLALDTGNGRQLVHRPDERFAMCSTFKWVLAAAILRRVERAQLSLDERISYEASDILPYSPTTNGHLAEGSMTVGALVQAAVTVSDNTAANLLLAKSAGPAGFTEFVRSLGDSVTRLDRIEPALNSNDADELRDTTSPRAMVGLMRQVLCGDALSPASREHLLGWLRASETGKERLSAGLPHDWLIGDKTGTGQRGAVNDVAIALPPGRAPILIASYLSDSNAGLSALTAAQADIGRLVAREL